jgi:hypothetical protein
MGYFKNLAIEQNWMERDRLQTAMYGDLVQRDSVESVFDRWADRLTPAERVQVLEDVLDYELWGQLMSTNILMKQAIYG